MAEITVPELSQEMIDYYLKFPVSNPAITDLYTVTPFGADMEFEWIHKETGEVFTGTIDDFNYHLLGLVV